MGETSESVIPYRENDISKLDVRVDYMHIAAILKSVLWIHLDS